MLADNTEWEQKDIEELEKKYYNEILTLLRDNEDFIKDMFSKLKSRIKDAKQRGMRWKKNNQVEIGLQELVRAVFYREKNWLPFMLGIASDTVFDTDDAILQTDIKTVKTGDQRGDDKERIEVHPNQSSYSGSIEVLNENHIFKGNLPTVMEEKPVLTFFVRFLWSVDDNQEVQIDEVTLSSIPNGELREIYPNLIVRFKTYFYPDGKKPSDFKEGLGYATHPDWTANATEDEKKLVKEQSLKARLEFQRKNGFCGDTTLLSVEESKSKPLLTTDWNRFTEIFHW